MKAEFETCATQENQVYDRAQSDQEIDLLDLIIVVARQKKTIGLITLCGTLLSVIVVLLLPIRYTAVTKIMPPQQNQSLSSAIMGQLAGLGALAGLGGRDVGLKNPNEIYVGMLSSRTVQDALVKRFGLMSEYHEKWMSDARKKLAQHTAIDLGKDGLISISVEDSEKGRSAALANGYVEELRNLTQTLAITEAGQRRLFFEQQLEKSKAQLADAEIALKQTQQKTGIIELSSQAKATIEALAQARAMIASKEVELHTIETFATDRNPEKIRLEQELAGMRAQVSKLEQQQNAGNGDIAVPTSKVPDVALEYVRRLREVKYQEAIFEALSKQFEIARLDEAKNAALIQVVDYAIEPDKRSFPKRTMLVAIAAAASLFLGIVWCFVLEGWKRLNMNPAVVQQLHELRRSIRVDAS